MNQAHKQNVCVCVNASHIYTRSNCDINMQTLSTSIQLKRFQKYVKPIFIRVFALKKNRYQHVSMCVHVARLPISICQLELFTILNYTRLSLLFFISFRLRIKDFLIFLMVLFNASLIFLT